MPADALLYPIPAATALSGAGTTTYASFALPAGTPNFGFVYRLLVSALGGTTPTVTVNIQDSRDLGTTWLTRQVFRGNLATSDGITVVGEYFARYVNKRRGDLVRMQVVLGGTTPTATIEMQQVSTSP